MRYAKQVPLDHRAIESLAQEVLLPQIKRWLEHHPKQDEPIGNVGAGRIAIGTIEFPAFMHNRVTYMRADVWVGAEAANRPGATVLTGGASLKDSRVVLYLNGAYSPAKMLKEGPQQPIQECHHVNCIAYGLYHTLVHEVTHLSEMFQDKPASYQVKQVMEQGATEDYVNDPSEVRAFLQQVVMEASQGAKHFVGRGWTNQKVVQMALKMSTVWTVIEKYLSPGNKAKILKAVYQEMDNLGQLDGSAKVAARWLTEVQALK